MPNMIGFVQHKTRGYIPVEDQYPERDKVQVARLLRYLDRKAAAKEAEEHRNGYCPHCHILLPTGTKKCPNCD